MEKDKLNELYKTPVNKRLKYIAMCIIGLAIALLITSIFMIESISWRLLCFMRGCAGLLAIVFVIIVGILVYRGNSAYIRQNRNHRRP